MKFVALIAIPGAVREHIPKICSLLSNEENLNETQTRLEITSIDIIKDHVLVFHTYEGALPSEHYTRLSNMYMYKYLLLEILEGDILYRFSLLNGNISLADSETYSFLNSSRNDIVSEKGENSEVTTESVTPPSEYPADTLGNKYPRTKWSRITYREAVGIFTPNRNKLAKQLPNELNSFLLEYTTAFKEESLTNNQFRYFSHVHKSGGCALVESLLIRNPLTFIARIPLFVNGYIRLRSLISAFIDEIDTIGKRDIKMITIFVDYFIIPRELVYHVLLHKYDTYAKNNDYLSTEFVMMVTNILNILEFDSSSIDLSLYCRTTQLYANRTGLFSNS